jgi:hypothetical protein
VSPGKGLLNARHPLTILKGLCLLRGILFKHTLVTRTWFCKCFAMCFCYVFDEAPFSFAFLYAFLLLSSQTYTPICILVMVSGCFHAELETT